VAAPYGGQPTPIGVLVEARRERQVSALEIWLCTNGEAQGSVAEDRNIAIDVSLSTTRILMDGRKVFTVCLQWKHKEKSCESKNISKVSGT